jgi:hypothetical protein
VCRAVPRLQVPKGGRGCTWTGEPHAGDARQPSWLRRQFDDELSLVKNTWWLYRREAGALVGGMLITVALLVFAIFLLSGVLAVLLVRGALTLSLAEVGSFLLLSATLEGPLLGGLVRMLLRRLREGRRGRAVDVFDGYRRFSRLAVAGLLGAVAVELAHPSGALDAHVAVGLAALVAGLILSVLVVYLVATIVDQGLPLGASVRAGLRLLRPPELWRTVVALLLLQLLGLLAIEPVNLVRAVSFTLGVLYLLVLLLGLAPLAVTYIVCMYVRARGEQGLLGQGPSGTAG